MMKEADVDGDGKLSYDGKITMRNQKLYIHKTAINPTILVPYVKIGSCLPCLEKKFKLL